MNQDLEHRNFSVSFEKRDASEGKAAVIVGKAAVFNSLSEPFGGFREIIEPGAFDGVLNDDVRALINHDPNLILGRTTAGTLRISADQKGLNYEIDAPDTQAARDLLVSMERGDITQSSFGFRVEEDSWDEDDDGIIIRTIHKVRALYDVSPVTYPAYQSTDSGISKRALDKVQEMRTSKDDSDDETESEAAKKRDLDIVSTQTTICEITAPNE